MKKHTSNLWSRLIENPVIIKELRGRMRGSRAFILITIYTILLGALVSAIFLGYLVLNDAPTTAMSLSQSIGKTLFGVILGLELCMICFTAPALTSGAISGERERQTYDILRTTLISEHSLILGKYVSALTFLVLLLLIAFPLQALAYLFGGIALEELLISFLLLLVTALIFSAIGIFISSLSHRVVGSNVISYLATSLIVFGFPIVIYVLIYFLGVSFFSSSYNFSDAQQTIIETLMLLVGWFFVSFNPIATAIVTELILLEEQSFLFINVPLSNGGSVFILSPWISYTIFYLLLSLLLLWWSTKIIKRRDS